MASAVKRRAHICFSSSCSFCRVLAPSGCQPVAGVARDPLPPQSPSFLKFPGYLAGSDGVWCRARGQTPRGMRFFDVFQWHYQIRAEQTHPEQAAPPTPCTRALSCAGAQPRWEQGKLSPRLQAELGAAVRFGVSQTPAISAKEKRWKFPPGLFSSV